MTQPALAFGPGSPAGSPGVAQRAMSGGMGYIPPIDFTSNQNSSARSGDAFQQGSTTGDGFSVNYGNGVSQGGAIPVWVWIAAAVGAGVWAWKRARSS